jgi:hypothetical protein
MGETFVAHAVRKTGVVADNNVGQKTAHMAVSVCQGDSASRSVIRRGALVPDVSLKSFIILAQIMDKAHRFAQLRRSKGIRELRRSSGHTTEVVSKRFPVPRWTV